MRQPSVPRPGNLRRDDVGAVIDVGTGRAVTVCGELDAASAPALSAALALLIDDDGEIYVEISAVGCEIAGFWAFYAQLLDACWIDDERVDPNPGSFYGGWITDNVTGPFKGGPGTSNW